MNVKALERVFAECRELAERKSSDYGATIDGIALAGVEGLAVRLLDKVARVHSLTHSKAGQKVKDESLRDTFRDICNYAAYGVMLLDGTWGVELASMTEEERREWLKNMGRDPGGGLRVRGSIKDVEESEGK